MRSNLIDSHCLCALLYVLAVLCARVVSQDSYGGELMQPLSQNRYLYALGDPVNYADAGGFAATKKGSSSTTSTAKTITTTTAAKAGATATTTAAKAKSNTVPAGATKAPAPAKPSTTTSSSGSDHNDPGRDGGRFGKDESSGSGGTGSGGTGSGGTGSGGTEGSGGGGTRRWNTILPPELDIRVYEITNEMNRQFCSVLTLRPSGKNEMSDVVQIRTLPRQTGNGTYNRFGAVSYALKYATSAWFKNDDKYIGRFDSDCTNFASHVLYMGGGLPMTESWYMNKAAVLGGRIISRLSDYSGAWTDPYTQYSWLVNSSYSNGVVSIVNADQIPDRVQQNIQAGDLIYARRRNDGVISHVSVIVEVTQDNIIYAQHSDDKVNGSLKERITRDSYYSEFIVVKIRG